MADNLQIIDGNGNSVLLKTKDVGSGVECQQSIPSDTSGNPTWGTAGTPNANVMSVQGIASGTPVPVATVGGAYTDRSGSMTAGNIAQQLMAANATRKRWFIQNPGTATGQGIATAESIFINFTSNAGVNDGASVEIFPGGSYSEDGIVSTEKITVIATTIAHKFVAKEM